MDTVCQKCGDRGYAETLVFCNICKIYAEHKYCMYEFLDCEDQNVKWSCEECMPRNDLIHSCQKKRKNPSKNNSSMKHYRDIHWAANDKNAPVVQKKLTAPKENKSMKVKEKLAKKKDKNKPVVKSKVPPVIGAKMKKKGVELRRRKLIRHDESELDEISVVHQNDKNTPVVESESCPNEENVHVGKSLICRNDKNAPVVRENISSPSTNSLETSKERFTKNSGLNMEKKRQMLSRKEDKLEGKRPKRNTENAPVMEKEHFDTQKIRLTVPKNSNAMKEKGKMNKEKVQVAINDHLVKTKAVSSSTDAKMKKKGVEIRRRKLILHDESESELDVGTVVPQNDQSTPVVDSEICANEENFLIGNSLIGANDQTAPVVKLRVDGNAPIEGFQICSIDKIAPVKDSLVGLVRETLVDDIDQNTLANDALVDDTRNNSPIQNAYLVQADKSVLEITQVGKNDKIAPIGDPKPKIDENDQKAHVIALIDDSDDISPIKPEPSRAASEESVTTRASLLQNNEFGIRFDSKFDKKKKCEKLETEKLTIVYGQTSRPTGFDSESCKIGCGLRSKGKGEIHRSNNHARRNYMDRVKRPSKESTVCCPICLFFILFGAVTLRLVKKCGVRLEAIHHSLHVRERWLSKMLPCVICMEKVYSPNIFETRFPENHDVDIFFFPRQSWVEEAVDELMHDMTKGDYLLKFSHGQAEFFVFSSSIFPEHFQRFHGRFHLWGLFKPRRLESSQGPPIHDSLNSNQNQNQNQIQAQTDGVQARRGSSTNMNSVREDVENLLDSKQDGVQQITENVEKHHDSNQEEFQRVTENVERRHDSSQEDFQQVIDDKRVTINFISQENKGGDTEECLNLFPEWSEDIAIRSGDRASDILKLELELGI